MDEEARSGWCPGTESNRRHEEGAASGSAYRYGRSRSEEYDAKRAEILKEL